MASFDKDGISPQRNLNNLNDLNNLRNLRNLNNLNLNLNLRSFLLTKDMFYNSDFK